MSPRGSDSSHIPNYSPKLKKCKSWRRRSFLSSKRLLSNEALLLTKRLRRKKSKPSLSPSL